MTTTLARLQARQDAVARLERLFADHKKRGFSEFGKDFESYFKVREGLENELRINKKAVSQLSLLLNK